jgi:molecular chaperone GrpE
MPPADDSKQTNQAVRSSADDAGGRDAAAADSVERLKQELEEKSAEAARNWDLYVRERADAENFRKRMQRDKADALRFACEGLVRDLLPVIDNLERAVDHADLGGNGQPLIEGVRLVLQNALEVLRRHGVGRIEAAGPFDPARHEAVVQVPDGKREPNQVVEQYEPGYTLHDRLIRPAKVSVSTKPAVERAPDDD